MKLNYYKSQSSVYPDLIDTTSSKKVVFLHKNIVKKTLNEAIIYEYEEAKLSKLQYQQYLNELKMIEIENQRADIDYIALMSGIDLEV